MAEITAKLVNELRARTNAPMMKCKAALTAAGGDIEKAIDQLRKEGVKESVAARAATEGQILGAASADGTAAVLVEINCNTDFTAKSQPVQELGAKAAAKLLASPELNLAEDGELVAGATAVAQQTGENVRIGKTAHLQNAQGRVGLYIYGITGKIGVLLSITGKPDDELIKDLGGHVAFTNPLAMTREQIPPQIVAREREIAVDAAKATGKPQNIAEKIAEGKLGAFFKERSLLDQDFFNAGKFKGTVAQMLKAAGCTLENYVRLEVGQ